MKPKLKMLEIRFAADQSSVQNAYEHIYDTTAIRHLDSFYRWILHLVQPETGSRLLDVACGQGVIPHMAAERGVEAYGFDLSFRAIREGHQSRAKLFVANGEHLPYPDESFDYITNIGSLEHYVDPEAGAREMTRVLAPDGLACILLPNTFSLSNMLYAWHNGRTTYDNQPIQRYATQLEWRDLLEANGLPVVKTVKFERVWPTSLADAAWYVRRPKNVAWLLLTPFLPLNLSNSFVYLCQR